MTNENDNGFLRRRILHRAAFVEECVGWLRMWADEWRSTPRGLNPGQTASDLAASVINGLADDMASGDWGYVTGYVTASGPEVDANTEAARVDGFRLVGQVERCSSTPTVPAERSASFRLLPWVEVGWLIERAAPPGSEWWTGDVWSRDSLDAVRFVRKVDALRAIACLHLAPAVATEHEWHNDTNCATTDDNEAAMLKRLYEEANAARQLFQDRATRFLDVLINPTGDAWHPLRREWDDVALAFGRFDAPFPAVLLGWELAAKYEAERDEARKERDIAKSATRDAWAAQHRTRDLLETMTLKRDVLDGKLETNEIKDERFRDRLRTLRAGCLANFGGGHYGANRDAFVHGMETVCNVVDAYLADPSADPNMTHSVGAAVLAEKDPVNAPITPAQRAELRRLATAVPESVRREWTATSEGDDPDSADWYVDARSSEHGGVQVCTMSNGGDEETARFIAAASPSVVTSLLDALDQASNLDTRDAEIIALRRALSEACGVLRDLGASAVSEKCLAALARPGMDETKEEPDAK